MITINIELLHICILLIKMCVFELFFRFLDISIIIIFLCYLGHILHCFGLTLGSVLRGLYILPGIEPRHVTRTASTLPVVLSQALNIDMIFKNALHDN